MSKYSGYILFSVVVIMLQVILFNNITFSCYLAPMIYIAVIIMLPLETPRFLTLMIGLLLGGFIDLSMGTIGLNIAATLPIAVSRKFLVNLVGFSSSMIKVTGIPNPNKFPSAFFSFVIIIVIVHSAIFFFLERFSIDSLWFTLLRLTLSSLVSIVVIRIVISLFSGFLFSSKS